MTEHEKLIDFERRLCERLGIAPYYEVCECGCISYGHWQDGCESRWTCGCTGLRIARKAYPAISRSGDGMLALMQALRRSGHDFRASRSGAEVLACGLPAFDGDWVTCEYDDLPLALAEATAHALGIEVPL